MKVGFCHVPWVKAIPHSAVPPEAVPFFVMITTTGSKTHVNPHEGTRLAGTELRVAALFIWGTDAPATSTERQGKAGDVVVRFQNFILLNFVKVFDLFLDDVLESCLEVPVEERLEEAGSGIGIHD
jgi:hypothetical protein